MQPLGIDPRWRVFVQVVEKTVIYTQLCGSESRGNGDNGSPGEHQVSAPAQAQHQPDGQVLKW